MMDLGIAGRKAIVAGGSAGLGRSTVLALAQEGVEVVASARGAERLYATAAEISEQTGIRVTPVVADHSTERGRHDLLEACPEPDIVVTTIGPPPLTPTLHDIREEDWVQSMVMGLLGPIELMRLTMDGMAARRWGRIVNIGTIAAKYPRESRLLSGAPRSALLNYTAVASRKMARHNVVINNVLPGIFGTDMVQERLGGDEYRGMTPDEAIAAVAVEWDIPAGRIGNPADLGKIIAVLCSEFANFVVGQNLGVDGGTGSGLF
jgi:3-oxoacyl-[acyl-carrier protein] reductase